MSLYYLSTVVYVLLLNSFPQHSFPLDHIMRCRAVSA